MGIGERHVYVCVCVLWRGAVWDEKERKKNARHPCILFGDGYGRGTTGKVERTLDCLKTHQLKSTHLIKIKFKQARKRGGKLEGRSIKQSCEGSWWAREYTALVSGDRVNQVTEYGKKSLPKRSLRAYLLPFSNSLEVGMSIVVKTRDATRPNAWIPEMIHGDGPPTAAAVKSASLQPPRRV